LEDEDRRAALVREGEDLRLAYWNAHAFNDPKGLQKESRRYDSKLLLPPDGITADPTVGAALADAKAQLQQAGRL
jgi:hypothetical protein